MIFINNFEELNKKLDIVNNTIFNMSLVISKLNENNKKNQKLLLKMIIKKY